MPIVFTACTQRKRVTPSPLLCARDLSQGSLQAVVKSWNDRIAKAEERVPAEDVYCGRSFFEAKRAARAAQAELQIVSAGLGLVHSKQEIPSYNLTVSRGGDDCVLDKLEGHGDADWWGALGGHEALRAALNRSSGIILIALPSAYLRMVAPALDDISNRLCERIRIVGGRNVPRLNPRLESARLPYDDRLDGPESSLPGTRSDFASRAARHFVEEILVKNPHASSRVHREQVEASLATWTRPTAKAGVRKSDEEVKSIVRTNWMRAGGRSTTLLRILRDELNIACEQKRFSNLVADIRKEKAYER